MPLIVLSLCASLVTALFCLSVFRLRHTVISFGAVYLSAGLWAAFILAPHYSYSAQGLAWLALAGALWTLGGFLGSGAPRIALIGHGLGDAQASVFLPSQRLIVLMGACGFVPFLMALQAAGFSITAMLDQSLVAARARYAGTGGQTALVNLLIVPAYGAALLAGIRAGHPDVKRTWWVLLLPLVATALVGMSQNSKASVIYGLSMWLGGYISATQMLRRPILSFRGFLAIVLLGYGLAQLFGFMQITRYGGTLTAQGWNEQLLVYAIGQISAFTLWFEQFQHLSTTPALGTETFRAIAEQFVPLEAIQGFDRYQAQITERYTTTVITGFAEMIKDFGKAGALLFIFVLSFFAGCMTGPGPGSQTSGVVVGAVFYTCIVFFPITSLLNYTTILLAFVLCFMIEMMAFRHRRRQLRHRHLKNTAPAAG